MKGHNYGLCKKCKKRHNHPRGALGNHSGWSKYNWNDLKELYLVQKLSLKEIATLKKCHYATVSIKLKGKGIKVQLDNSGEKNPFYGKKHTELTKKEISKFHKNHTYNIGRKYSYMIGDRNPAKRPEVRKKISQNTKGKSKNIGSLNANWKGGERDDPYPRLFYSTRSLVLERDNYTCQDCGNKGNTIHHKNENKNNNSIDNLVTLCGSCHTIRHWKNHKDKLEKRELCVS